MRRPETLKKILIESLMEGGLYGFEVFIESLRRLPVIAKHKASKEALIKELKALDKQYNDTYRRSRAAADRVERLSLDPTKRGPV